MLMNRERHGSSRSRHLEDILQNPDASWSQIREAMKSSSRGCTNVAIMGAIASGRGVVDHQHDKEKLTGSDVGSAGADASILSTEIKNSETTTKTTQYYESQKNATPVEPTSNNNDNGDITNSGNRRHAQRRQGSSHRSGPRSSFGRKSQRGGIKGGVLPLSTGESNASANSLKSSINIMDFGVDHNITGMHASMSTLNESVTFDDVMLSRKGSVMSDDNSASYSGSGFLGWNHDDESVYSISVRSNYSDLVDSSGFLDWDNKSRNSQPDSDPLISPTLPSKITTGLESHGLVEGSECHRNSLSKSLTSSLGGSFTSSFNTIRVNPIEQWNIEDYENPEQDNKINVVRSRRSNYFGSRFKQISKKDQHVTPTNNDTINMNDIKEALIKVASSSDHDENRSTATGPASRRTSLEDEYLLVNGIAGRSEKKKAASNKANESKRRQTLIGVPAFLGSSVPNETNSKTFTGRSLFLSSDNLSDYKLAHNSHHCQTTSACALARPTSSSQKEIHRRRSSDKSFEGTFWDGLKADSSHADLREAIWINRKDGDVNIEKECRKLYCEENRTQDDTKMGQQRGSWSGVEGLRRRATFAFGAERPRLSMNRMPTNRNTFTGMSQLFLSSDNHPDYKPARNSHNRQMASAFALARPTSSPHRGISREGTFCVPPSASACMFE